MPDKKVSAFKKKLLVTIERELQTSGWPKMKTPPRSVEAFFDEAHATARGVWHTALDPMVRALYAAWIETLKKKPTSRALAALLADEAGMADRLVIRQLGALEPLRQILPDAWQSLLVMTSTQQHLAIRVATRWLARLKRADFERLGMTRRELTLFLEMARTLQEPIDHAYLQQMKLADLPGGNRATPLTRVQGGEYLYETMSPKTKKSERHAYRSLFPKEFSDIVRRLTTLAKKVRRECQHSALPSVYGFLADYLDDLARMYGSSSTDPSLLFAGWHGLSQALCELAVRGCPILLTPQSGISVAGAANKVDVEIRLGLKTLHTKQLEKHFQPFRRAANILHKDWSSPDHPARPLPPTIVTYQAFAYGPNLHWATRGEADRDKILCHTNSTRDVALRQSLPLVQALCGQETFDKKKWVDMSAIATLLHEIGHAILPIENPDIRNRVGAGVDQQVIEEVKADMIGMKILATAMANRLLPPTFDPATFLLGMIGDSLYAVSEKSSRRGSSGERYYIPGLVILHVIHREKAFKKKNDTLSLDRKKIPAAIQSLARLGDKILRLYAKPTTSPEDIKVYVRRLRVTAHDPFIAAVVHDVKRMMGISL